MIWQKNQLGLNYGESFHAYAMSSNISQLKLSYIVRIDIEIYLYDESARTVSLVRAFRITRYETICSFQWTLNSTQTHKSDLNKNNATVLYSHQLNDSYDYKL